MKATHFGHCQVCGAAQKLPSGLMAKHGYTKNFGFFNGTCFGSGELPFEQSCEMVKASIVRAQELMGNQVAHQAELRNSTELTGKVWYHCYFTGNGLTFKSGYYWKECTYTVDDPTKEYPTYMYQVPDGKGLDARPQRLEIPFDRKDRTPLAVEIYYRHRRAEAMERDITELRNYIKSQQLRVKEWKLSPVTPVAKFPK